MAIIREVDPVSRIEGHLGLKVYVGDTGYVSGCDAHGNLWRGFENFLIDRQPNDAITFTQRICGVCPVPHGTTSTYAVDSVLGYSNGYITFSDMGNAANVGVPTAAVHIRNLVLGAEFLMSSITHFYHLAAPSYVQGPNMAPWTPYFNDGFYHPLLLSNDRTAPLASDTSLWAVVIRQYVKALRIRRLTFEAGALFAGRMPMTSALVAGGVPLEKNDAKFASRVSKFYTLMKEVGDFVIHEYVPLVLALGALYPNFDNLANATTLNGAFPALWAMANQDAAGAPAPANTGWGGGLGNFLAWGGFPQPNEADQVLAIKGGYMWGLASGAGTSGALMEDTTNAAAAIASVKANLVEDTAEARYNANTAWGYGTGQTWAKPGDVTRTEPDREGGYTWLKAPRWKCDDGIFRPMEVGPMARMYVNGFFVKGQTLASTVALDGMWDYADYTNGAGALDAGTLSADLVAGLSNADGAGLNLVSAAEAWILNLKAGLSTMDRLRARAIESLYLVQRMIGGKVKGSGWATNPGGWLGALSTEGVSRTWKSGNAPVGLLSGFGATEAPRGALAHFITRNGNKIAAYQCVVPTTWNGSPKDGMGALSSGEAGPIEAAVIGSKYDTTKTVALDSLDGTTTYTCEGGVEALRIAQSFDPCIACAVH